VSLHSVTPPNILGQHFLEDGLAGVVQFCGHIGAVIFISFNSFFWVYAYAYVNYISMDKIRELNNLKARVRESAEQLTKDMLWRVWQVVEYVLDICRVTNGAQNRYWFLEYVSHFSMYWFSKPHHNISDILYRKLHSK
jgi:hypothetical protein